jgi:hypothetical protein
MFEGVKCLSDAVISIINKFSYICRIYNMTEGNTNILISWIRHADTNNVLFENFAEDEYQFANDINNNLEISKKYDKISNVGKLIFKYENTDDLLIAAGIIEQFNKFNTSYFNTYPDSNIKGKYVVNKDDTITDPYGNNCGNIKDYLQISIDYQYFRKKLLHEEEQMYIRHYKYLIERKIEDLNNALYDKKNTEQIKTASKMIKYEFGKQYINENKIDKLKSPVLMPASWMFTPTLSYVGVIEAMELSEKLDITYDFITSASVRTIMTAAIALITYGITYGINKKILDPEYKPKPKTIHVVPYINELSNGGSLIDSDISNSPIPKEIINEIIKKILEWLSSEEFFTITKLENFEVEKFEVADYVIINTDNYKEIVNIETHKEKITSLLALLKENNFDNVYAFTHGNFINERRIENKQDKFNPFPNSCSIWTETFHNDYSKKDLTAYNGNYDKPIEGKQLGNRGGQVRRLLKVSPYDELYNLKTNHFSSLDPNKLRGQINEIWHKHLGWLLDKPTNVGGKLKKKTYKKGRKTFKRKGRKTSKRQHKTKRK